MYSHVVTKDAAAVEGAVQAAYLDMFPGADKGYVPRVFGWADDCFSGRFGNYLPIDAKYHDFEHTLQGTLCLVRILQGRHQARVQPEITEKMFQLGLLAILLHDTGYLKEKWDITGTGAKYTVIHVRRSAEFASNFLKTKGYSDTDIKAVQDMIFCTGVNAALDKIPFQDELEKIMGLVLGTADLLGQMAADDYAEKLPVLYSEFAEASLHEGKPNVVGGFTSADDLRQKTPGFWEKYVKAKLERDFNGVYRFMNSPYPDGENYYLNKIEQNIAQVRQELATRV